MDSNLTEAYIKPKEGKDEFKFFISKNKISNFDRCPFFLIIQSYTDKYIRITIYPITKSKILKISFLGKKILKNTFDQFLNLIKTFDIIHTSGLISKGDKIFYECYLNHNLHEIENSINNNITTNFNRIRLIKEIKINEIETT